MNTIISYEIKAEAFRRMTGHMAPGKYVASSAYEAPFEERMESWNAWNSENHNIIKFMLLAADEFIVD